MRPIPSRRSVLAGLAGVGLAGWSARASAPGKRLILVVSSGGWDPTFSVDPKPGILGGGPYPDVGAGDDREEIVEYGEIRVTCNDARRPSVRRFFDGWAGSTVVVNGLWTTSLSHWTAMDRILTGRDAPGAPDVAAITGVARGGDTPLATIDLSGLSRFGSLAPSCGRAGVRAQLAALLDPSIRFDTPTGADRPGFDATAADHDAIAGFLAARGGRDGGEDAWRERTEALDRADRLREADLALSFGRRTAFQDQVPYAIELLASGACNALVLGTGFAWDTHADASRQHASWDGTFAGLGILASGLDAAGLFADTVVVAVSDLGREPERNVLGGTGHWAYTSALVLGGSVDGGRVVGGTDDAVVGVGVDRATGRPSTSAPPLDPAAFAAGVLTALDVDPGDWLPGIVPVRGLV